MRWIKKIGIAAGILVLLFLIIIAALPLWLPWALGPVLSRLDVEYDSYERVGYGRFELSEVTYTRKGLRVEAAHVEGFVPTAWLWNLWRGKEDVDYAAVDDWRVEIERVEDPTPPPEEEPKDDVSVYEIVEILEKILPRVAQWAPRASVGEGELMLVDREIEVRGATWRRGLLTAEVLDEPTQQVVQFEGDVTDGLPYLFRGELDPFPFHIEVTISRVENHVSVRSEAYLAGNRLVADADFPREGYLPTQARFRSDDFLLPTEFLDIEGYEDIEGSLQFEWLEGSFSAALRGQADPVEDWGERLPPLRVEASARGDLESFLVEQLEIRSPWLVAILSDPVAMDYSGELLSGESHFELAADLSEQPFVELEGEVRGELTILPGDDRFPWVDFSLNGAGLAGFDLELDRVETSGTFRWPEVTVTSLVVEAREGSRGVASAVLDLETMEFGGGRAEVRLHPALVAHWLPDDLWFSEVSLIGEFAGPILDLGHEGRIEFEDFQYPPMHPIAGNLVWRGQMENLSALAVELTSGEGRFVFDGSTDLRGEQFELVLNELRLERGNELLLEAMVESRISVDWATEGVTISLDQLHWAGPDGESRKVEATAEVSWPERGHFAADVRGLSTDLATDFVDVEVDFISLVFAEFEGAWEEGPLDFRAVTEIRMNLEDEEVLFLGNIQGEGEELRVDEFRAVSRDEALVFAEGNLPVGIWPGQDEILQIREDGEMSFQARTNPEASVWTQLGDLVGIRLQDPHLTLEVTGTPQSPVGRLQASAPLINLQAWDDEEHPIPVLEDLLINLQFDLDRVHLEELSLNVEGQRIEVEASLPMGDREWRTLMRDRELPDWERVSGRVAIPEARVAAFTRFAPTILSPQGTLQANIEILPGGRLDGLVTVSEMATRPLMPFGTLRDGSARVVLKDRTAFIEQLSVTIGGERLGVTGEVDIPFEQPLAFDLAVRGQNLPLARRPGVVIRGDLDLAARSRDGEIPVISGRIDLRDSFYLAHLRLMPGGAVATPDRRPPFFSVEAEPFANWRLNVDLRGPGFLSVRGPIFQGMISSSFNLSGTLVEPRAIGAANIDSGRVRFPFASMNIVQGEVALRREDPFQPQLFIVASGMAFGYDLTMEITGTAEAPVIEFMANPPLTSEQALLMITTGELPREEIRFTTQQRASRFAIYFGQNLLYELTGDDSAGDRLTIRSGEQVSESGRETMAIEYRLTDRFSVVGEYDRFDEYNAGIKWNIYSR